MSESIHKSASKTAWTSLAGVVGGFGTGLYSYWQVIDSNPDAAAMLSASGNDRGAWPYIHENADYSDLANYGAEEFANIGLSIGFISLPVFIVSGLVALSTSESARLRSKASRHQDLLN